MKKLFVILSLALIPLMAQAAKITVTLANAKNPIEGTVLSFSDTLVVMEPKSAPGKTFVLPPDKVKYFIISGIGKYYSVDGKFVPDEKTQAKLEKAKQPEIERAYGINNLNEALAKAFKSTGGVCMGIGIPSLIAGSVLVGIGNSGDLTVTKTKCATTGYVLMSTGAALTIVGIPLHVHGKRIAELNFNYTGNGAGLALNF